MPAKIFSPEETKQSSSNDFRENLRRNPTLIKGAPGPPLLTRAMKYVLNMGMCCLSSYVIIWVLSSAGLITLLFHYGACYSAGLSIWNGYMLSMSLILGGGGPSLNETGTCALFSLFSTAIAFVTDIGVIAVFVNKVTHPQSDILFSKYFVVRNRNGKTLLQFRFINSFGHVMLEVEVRAFYYYQTVSLEGESYTAIQELTVDCSNYGGSYPLNVNVVIDEDSPLWGEDFSNFHGSLHISLTGFDASLQTSVTKERSYTKEHLRVGHKYMACLDKGPGEAAASNSRMEVSLERFHSTEEESEEQRVLLLRTLQRRKQEKARLINAQQRQVMSTMLHAQEEDSTVKEQSAENVQPDEDAVTSVGATVETTRADFTAPVIKKKKSLLKMLKLR